MTNNQLPSFDEFDSQSDDNDDFPSIDELLDDFESEKDDELSIDEIHDIAQNETDSKIVSESDSHMEELDEPDFDTEFEDFKESTSTEDLNGDFDIEDDYVQEPQPEELTEDEYAEEHISEPLEAVADEEDETEENYEEEFGNSLLPGMNLEVEEESEPEPDSDLSSEPEGEVGADEKAKEFFMSLKDKLMNIFKKKDDSEGNPLKKRSSKRELGPKSKSPLSGINKTQKIIFAGIGLIVILIIAALLLSLKSYSNIDEMSIDGELKDKDSDEHIKLVLKDLEANDKNLTITTVNDGDMSATFSVYLTFKQKSVIPFLGKKTACESDIVYLETDGQAQESLKCEDKLDKSEKYKVNVEIDKF